MNISSALSNLVPGASWALNGDEIYANLEWFDTERVQPTESAITAEVTRLQDVYDGLAYSRTRKAAYNLLEQDEMRYDDLVNSTTTWADAIAAIKAEFPKP